MRLALLADTTFIEIAMLIFMAVFVGIVIWVVAARRGTFSAASRIPLSDEPVEPRLLDGPSSGNDRDDDERD